MSQCRILVPQGCRSDIGLSTPIVDRLRKDSTFEVFVWRPRPNFKEAMERFNAQLRENDFDLVFITGDRVEMVACAIAAFHANIPIAHYYAGVLNDPITTYDDVNRHCITLWSDIQFTEDSKALANVWQLCWMINKAPNVYDVGISHLDDLKVDESKVPDEPYDLVLINPITVPKSEFEPWFIHGHDLKIWIGSNPDGEVRVDSDVGKYYDNLPRPQFLGLLKNCKRFITNSSSAIYEAPHFLNKDQIIMIGKRNKRRSRSVKYKTGASNRIVKLLKVWWDEQEEKKE